MIRRALKTPAGILWLVGCLVAGPLLDLFTPRGLLGHSDDPIDRVLQLGYLASLFGIMLALNALQQTSWMLERTGPLTRISFRWLALVTLGTLGPITVAAAQLLMGHHIEWLQIGTPLLHSVLHQTVLAALLLEAKSLKGAVVMAFPFLTWILPALVTVQNTSTRWLHGLLRCTTQGTVADDSTPIELLAGFGPILVIATSHGLYVLLRHTHEVRHSRRHPRKLNGA